MDRQAANNIKTRREHCGSTLFAFAAFLFFSANAFSSTDFKLPPEHKSTYSIEKFGTQVGYMFNELRQSGEQVSYTSKIKATGFASLFVRRDAQETSILSWFNKAEGRTLQQLSYRLFRGKNHKKNQDISFDWSDTTAVKLKGSYKSRSYKLTSSEHVWGRHLLPLLLSNDLLSKAPSANIFHITDKGGLQKYTYTLEKTDKISIAGKEYPALKFRTKREGSDRMSYIWVSKAHYYQPLRIEQYKDGKLNASMLMTKFELTHATPAATIAQEEVDEDD